MVFTVLNASRCPGSYADSRFDTDSGLPEGIKLGLGDFIFYSMLVGRASMHDLLTAAAAYLAIIAGERLGPEQRSVMELVAG